MKARIPKNEELKEHYFYKWGKGEKRDQTAIFNDFFKKKYGLRATKKDVNVLDYGVDVPVEKTYVSFRKETSNGKYTEKLVEVVDVLIVLIEDMAI